MILILIKVLCFFPILWLHYYFSSCISMFNAYFLNDFIFLKSDLFEIYSCTVTTFICASSSCLASVSRIPYCPSCSLTILQMDSMLLLRYLLILIFSSVSSKFYFKVSLWFLFITYQRNRKRHSPTILY